MTDMPVPPLYMRRAGFDPVAEVSEVREGPGITRAPTLFGVDAWVVTRFEDVREVMSRPDLYSNAGMFAFRSPDGPQLPEEVIAELSAGNLLSLDPPEHTRLRRMLTPEFTQRRIRRLEPRIREIVEDHLDAMERTGPPADLVSDFAMPVPSLVICELLGVPYADRAAFQERSRRILDQSSLEEGTAATMESRAYITGLVRTMRDDPGDDLLGMLIREHGDDLADAELAGIGNLLLLAGHETTANMLSLGTLALLRHPDQLALLRAEPDRLEAAVEELLRWLSVVHTAIFKLTTTEVEVAGQTVGPGEMIICALSAANRDPSFVTDPRTLDVTRGALGHVAFGHGVHHCLGAPLARMELRTALPALLGRFPALRLAGQPAWRTFSAVYGVDKMPVEW